MASTTNAITGQGTTFKRGEIDIAEINSISGPTMSRETIETTVLSDTDGYRRFIGGLRDAGTVSLDMNFTMATYNTMKEDFEDEDEQSYTITLPDGSTLEFSGLVTECPLEVPIGDKVTANITLQVSGEVTFTPGSSL